MEVLEFSGKKYLKASAAARETGYTSDYIAQLCRGGKIDSRLVGRAWYVAEDAIKGQRKGNSRSNIQKTREEIQSGLKMVATPSEDATIAIKRYVGGMPEYKKRLLGNTAILYERDENKLLPHVEKPYEPFAPTNKAVHIGVTIDKSPDHVVKREASIKVVADSPKEVVFAKEEPKKIEWNGTIVVSSLDTEETQSAGKADGNEDEVKEVSEIADTPLPTEFVQKLNRAHILNDLEGLQEEAVPKKSLILYPALGAGVIMMILAVNVFMQSVWVFERGSGNSVGERAFFEVSYGVSSISSVLSSVNN